MRQGVADKLVWPPPGQVTWSHKPDTEETHSYRPEYGINMNQCRSCMTISPETEASQRLIECLSVPFQIPIQLTLNGDYLH